MSVASEKSEKMSRPYSSEGKPEEVVTTDIEDSRPYGAPAPLKRALKNRHVAMISAHAGVIGTGLFLGTAQSLHNGGPIGLVLGYITMGTICYSVMVSLGEMIAYLPIAGGHIKLAERFVDPALSFTMGWNYWYNWTILLPAELSASAILMNYWVSPEKVNNAVWITMCLVVVVFINFLGAGAYGEAEFIFASIKVITIVGLIILGIVIDLGGGPNHDRLGFRYWKDPGPFAQYHDIQGSKGQFLGWWAVITQAAFSFIGTEIVAIAAAEAKNPRRNLPRAIKRVYIRILLFYICGTIVIGLLVPSNNERLVSGSGTASSSPFVIAIENAGISVLPHIVNACLLTSAWSAASSDLYTSSRALYGLSVAGNAPKIFQRTTRWGLPYVSLIFSTAFALLAYMSVDKNAGEVFNWFQNMTAIAGMMTWFGISITYLRFHAGCKAQNIDRKKLPYWNIINPYAAWYSLVATFVICFFSGWSVFLRGNWATDTFVTNYFPLWLFPILYIGSKLYYRQPIVKASEMDFVSNIAEIEADCANDEDAPPRNKFEAFWRWLM
ncbi:amino acid permease/ SLC12A domain-containing protein [Schizophyllum commune]